MVVKMETKMIDKAKAQIFCASVSALSFAALIVAMGAPVKWK